VGYAPRAKTTNVRTRTHLRRWGIADQLAAASPFGVDYPSNVVFTTRLSGTELARFADAFNTAPARNPLYPEHAQWIPQYKLEEVLRSHVATLSTVKLRFNVEFESFTQDDEHAEAHFRNVADSRSFSARARYLVGADGTRSKVRELIGATMSGRQGLSYNYNIIFRAPGLMQAHRHGPAIFYWQINGDAPSALGPMDRDDVWFIGLVGLARDTRLTDEQARAHNRYRSSIRNIELRSMGGEPPDCHQIPGAARIPGGRCLPSPSAVWRLWNEHGHRRWR
jgi:2-polyprenyl-6-methoxyphenol hydroxylase-like FAD-dependent oxidoreductase